MGCSSSKPNTSKSYKLKLLNPPNNDHKRICNYLIPMLDNNNIYNINKKYSYMIKVIENKMTGIDIKSTNSYICKISKEELEIKINEFWETRVDGNMKIWNWLKSISTKEIIGEDDYFECFNLNLRFISNTLEISYDSKGNRYDLPIFVLNPPDSYQTSNLDYKSKEVNKTLKVNFIYIYTKLDMELNLGSKIEDIIENLYKKLEVDRNKYLLRLSQLGKIFNNMNIFYSEFNEKYPCLIFKVNIIQNV